MLTNQGLVEHVKRALTEKWGYVWGTFGQVLTPVLFEEKLSQYPVGVGKYEDFIRDCYINKRTVDCVGLIKSYMWWNGGSPEYIVYTDVSANGMFELATEKGLFNDFPISHQPGLCLWKDGHIGVYIGDGQVIEARGTLSGVMQPPLTGRGSAGWSHWLKCPFIKYEIIGGKNMEEKKAFQIKLNKLGYNLLVDGILGEKTISAIKHFQETNNILSDGFVDEITQISIDTMVNKLENGNKKHYIEIIQDVASNPNEWIKGIDTAVKLAKTDGNLGDLKIFEFLPELIEKIGNKKPKILEE